MDNVETNSTTTTTTKENKLFYHKIVTYNIQHGKLSCFCFSLLSLS